MKKLLTILTVLALTGSVAFAASKQAKITLKTTVDTIESVAFDKDDDTVTDLLFDNDDMAKDKTDFALGSIFLNSNAAGGFLLTFTNNTSSKLVNGSGSELGYTLKITNGAGDTAGDNPLSAANKTAVTFGNNYDFTANVGGDITVDKEFSLDLTLASAIQDAGLQAGEHSSIITVEIANQ